MTTKAKFSYPHKLFDTARVPRFGRVDAHWLGRQFISIFQEQRKAPKLPILFKKRITDQSYVLKYFNLRAFEYGNWLSQEDRWQYYLGAAASLIDLAKVTGLEADQIGLAGNVTLAFGARGRSKALAHFEPSTFAINLTRYKEGSKWLEDMKYLEANTGVGSLGHEWAHALDCFLCLHHAPNKKNYLSELIHMHLVPAGETYSLQSRPQKRIEKLFFELMLAIMFKPTAEAGKYEQSDFYKGLIAEVGSGPKGDYWTRPREIFARSFEVFLTYEGQRKKIQNRFLHKNKYDSAVYPTKDEYKAWRKHMLKILDFAAENIPQTERLIHAS